MQNHKRFKIVSKIAEFEHVMNKSNHRANVGKGHPDKICDQISDAILDHILSQDPTARVAIETLCKSNVVILAGEITSNSVINYRDIVSAVIKNCGYDFGDIFDYRTFELIVNVNKQSSDISQCVDTKDRFPDIVIINGHTDGQTNVVENGLTVMPNQPMNHPSISLEKDVEVALNGIEVSDHSSKCSRPGRFRATDDSENRPFMNIGDHDKKEKTANTKPIDIEKESSDTELPLKEGAGDQGVMFGFACSDTPQLMPLPHVLATNIVRLLNDIALENTCIKTDCKAQVTVEYENNKPARIDTVIASVHTQNISLKDLRELLVPKIVQILPQEKLRNSKIIIQPSGCFEKGGPSADCGLTGRKIICDAYGSAERAGGGCFSGKDPTKVDRSGAYFARYIAKNLVYNKLCEKATVELAFAIGMPKPVCISVNSHNTGTYSDAELTSIVEKNFDCSVSAIIDRLRLRRPIFAKTAVYGHFGNTEYPWEETFKLDY